MKKNKARKRRPSRFTCPFVPSTLLSWQLCVAQIHVDILEAISSACSWNRAKHPGRRCQAYPPDLLDPMPPGAPASAGKRLRVINGGKA